MPPKPLDTIQHGDCIEGMRLLPDGCASLVVADPPYNLEKDFGAWKEREQKARWLPWSKDWIAEAVRVLAPGGNIFIYGIHHHLCWIQCHLYEIGLTYRRQIIWYYENGFAGYTKALERGVRNVLISIPVGLWPQQAQPRNHLEEHLWTFYPSKVAGWTGWEAEVAAVVSVGKFKGPERRVYFDLEDRAEYRQHVDEFLGHFVLRRAGREV